MRRLEHLRGLPARLAGDGTPKGCAWAAPICGVTETRFDRSRHDHSSASVCWWWWRIHCNAPNTVSNRCGWALCSRAALGQLGLPGGGYNYALGTLAHYGKRNNAVPAAALPQGDQQRARIHSCGPHQRHAAQPGTTVRLQRPATKSTPTSGWAYWAGGNPFHHHQDLKRLADALSNAGHLCRARDRVWTATARHADIVLPCTMTLEREDIGATPTDPLLVAMHRITEAARPGARRLRHLL